ncbi:MAG TPA: glycerophosphoryl diester phosphodiesterase membrane domain-containing protein [Streptosporangiaceae bacterium]|nr:glycerophosphoryl diester phosphodiesterase membrane domain-containing protein [Streptosporangiaceae bacterium]
MADNPSPGMDVPGGPDNGSGSWQPPLSDSPSPASPLEDARPPQDTRPPHDASPSPAGPQPWFPPSEQTWVPPGTGTSQPPPGASQPPPGSSYGQPGWTYGQSGPGQGQRTYAPWPAPPAAPKPGVIPLRPLAVGEILDGAFSSIRRNPRATLGIAAVLLTAYQVINTIVTVTVSHSVGSVSLPAAGQTLTAAQVNHLLHTLLVFVAAVLSVYVVLGFVLDIVLSGLLTVVIGRLVLGKVISAGEAWQVAWPRLLPLLGVTLLTGLVAFSPWIVFIPVVIGLAAGGAPGGIIAVVVILGGIAALCLTVWFAIMFRLAGPVVVLERQSVGASMARSWQLVKGSFWRVFGISLLAVVIVFVASAILQIPFNLLAAATGGPATLGGGSTLLAGSASPLSLVITAIGGIVAGSVTQPIAAGVAVLLYVDLRMRREGLDLVLQTATSGGAPSSGDEFASVWRPGARAAAAPVDSRPGSASPDGATQPPGTPPAW